MLSFSSSNTQQDMKYAYTGGGVTDSQTAAQTFAVLFPPVTVKYFPATMFSRVAAEICDVRF